jgi:hypothetical protein
MLLTYRIGPDRLGFHNPDDSLEVPMHARSLAVLARLSAVVALAPIVLACGDDETSPTDAMVGTWNVTSFTAGGTNFIAGGMTLSIALTSAGTYTLTVTNDLIDSCDPGPNCTQTGNWTATTTTITINSGTVDATTFDYTRSGNTMTWTGEIDTTPVVIVLSRQ